MAQYGQHSNVYTLNEYVNVNGEIADPYGAPAEFMNKRITRFTI